MSDRRALLLVYPGFAELQVAPALDLLRGEVEVVVAAPARGAVRSEGGLAVLPEATWEELAGQPFAAVLVPGAIDLKAAYHHAALPALLAAAASGAEVVGAICGGPMLLHSAGLLDGRRYTTNFSAEQRALLGAPEGSYVDDELVVDGRLITARGHAHGRFGLAVAEALGIDVAPLRHYVLQSRASCAPPAAPSAAC